MTMNKIIISYAVATLTSLFTAQSFAQMFIESGQRSGRTEFTIQAAYQGSETFDLGEGSEMKTSSDTGFGMSFGHNIDNHWNIGFGMSFNNASYNATVPEQGSSNTTTIKSKVDSFNGQLNATYHLLEGNLTPFVTGGIGWTYSDSNIADGPASSTCWYDPWYGYYRCGYYQSTHTDTSFSYSAAAGLRWDISDKHFLRGSIGKQWVNMSIADNTPSFTLGRIEFGFMM
jgi:outer membrane protein assembly factor BamA